MALQDASLPRPLLKSDRRPTASTVFCLIPSRRSVFRCTYLIQNPGQKSALEVGLKPKSLVSHELHVRKYTHVHIRGMYVLQRQLHGQRRLVCSNYPLDAVWHVVQPENGVANNSCLSNPPSFDHVSRLRDKCQSTGGNARQLLEISLSQVGTVAPIMIYSQSLGLHFSCFSSF